MNAAKTLKRTAAFAAIASVLALGGAQAQIGGQEEGEGPVAVTSAYFEYLGDVAVYRGQVQAIQGQTRLNCSELRIFFPPSRAGRATGGGGNADRYECSGPVYYVTPTIQARANAGVFTAPTDTIVLTGDVTVREGLNVAQGHRLTINTRTRNSKLEATGAAPRVRTVIYPDEDGGSAAAPAAPARPTTRRAMRPPSCALRPSLSWMCGPRLWSRPRVRAPGPASSAFRPIRPSTRACSSTRWASRSAAARW